jgi:hypothetical protein
MLKYEAAVEKTVKSFSIKMSGWIFQQSPTVNRMSPSHN